VLPEQNLTVSNATNVEISKYQGSKVLIFDLVAVSHHKGDCKDSPSSNLTSSGHDDIIYKHVDSDFI
jgi:hypothetical protein